MAEKSPFSLVASLNEKGYSASVVATYNAYLPFYEQVVLRRLQAAGCSHNLVLMDAAQCSAALASEELRPRLAGLGYTLIPVSVPGAFHPKVFLRLGRTRGCLYVGSHNLTVAGYGFNDELTNVFVHEQGTSRSTPPIFRAVLEFLARFLPEGLLEIRQAFDAALDIAPWLQAPAPVDESVYVLCTDGGDESLWQHLRGLIKGRVQRAFVMAPFFDADLRFLSRLAGDLNPKELVVALESERVEIPAEKARRMKGVRFVEIGDRSRSHRKREDPTSYLHAKAYWFQTDQAEILATGSANASAPAFLATTDRRNAEILLARVAPPGHALAEEAEIAGLLRLPQVTEEGWQSIAERRRPVLVDASDHAGRCLIAVAVDGGFVVEAPIESDAAVQVLDAAGATIGAASVEASGPPARLRAPDDTLELARFLEVRTRSSVVRAIIHNPREIADLYTDDTRRALRQSLGAIDDDPAQIETLLKLTEKAIFDADAATQIHRPGTSHRTQSDESDEGHGEKSPDSLAVDAQGRRVAARRRSLAAGDIAVLLDALIRRLGEGLREAQVPAGPSEEEKIGSDDEADQLPPVPVDIPRLASLCRRKVRRLLDRMSKQLDLAREKEEPRRAIIQLAAVLCVLNRLRIVEQRAEWRQARECLLDEDDLSEFFELATQALGCGEEALIDAALEKTEGERFEELSIALGMLVWLSWECEPEPIEDEQEWSGEYVDEEAVLCWRQHLLYVGSRLVEDSRALKYAEEAIQRTPRRKHDSLAWFAEAIGLLERVAEVQGAPLEKHLQRQPRQGDLVLLPKGFTPRVRLAIRTEVGTRGLLVSVLDAEKDEGERKFSASYVHVLDWTGEATKMHAG